MVRDSVMQRDSYLQHESLILLTYIVIKRGKENGTVIFVSRNFQITSNTPINLAHTAKPYPGFSGIQQLGVLLMPLNGKLP